jgi:hypothetical protein
MDNQLREQSYDVIRLANFPTPNYSGTRLNWALC